MTEAEQAIGTPGAREAHGGARPGAGKAAAGPGAEEAAARADRAAAGAGAGPVGRRRVPVLLAVAAVAYLLDLGSKLLVVARLEHGEPVDILGAWLRLEVIRNRGAAFGLGEAMTIVFTVIAAVVIGVIARLARKLYSLPWAVALGLLLGGAFGNLTDRVFRSPGDLQGAVVDFIAPAHFAVFNLADSAIVCGGVLIVVLSFRGLDPDGTVHQD
ncbi:signal peptidase II [Streptomyces sp. B1866]|uniref:signal peptidase II n=1 Tax=Streptomyces sp. B1866 TaxID=3075431 RepID=UPI00288F2868|nr:signal peptidase II [Streptomyces sp. B1866]MDT3398769.1 signal peptidase II [Streptomyces sp. B1866]